MNVPDSAPSALVDPGVARGRWQDHDWHDGVVEFPAEVLARLPLPPDQLQYLQQAGLPRSAAPYLTFDDRPPEVLQDLIWEPDPAAPTAAMSCWAATGPATRSRWTSTGPARWCSWTTAMTSRRC
jgi:hypothetical protein